MAFFVEKQDFEIDDDIFLEGFSSYKKTKFEDGRHSSPRISVKYFSELANNLPLESLTAKNHKFRRGVQHINDISAISYAKYLNMKWAQYLRCVGGFISGSDEPLSLAAFASAYLSCDGKSGEKVKYKSRNYEGAAKDWFRRETGFSKNFEKLIKVFDALQAEIFENSNLHIYLEQFTYDHRIFTSDIFSHYDLLEREMTNKKIKTQAAKNFLSWISYNELCIWDENRLKWQEDFLEKLRIPLMLEPQVWYEINLIRKRLISKKNSVSLLRRMWLSTRGAI